ncbi:MAG TPA: ABC transporter ATP-binding protein [Chloroflexota bacterium]
MRHAIELGAVTKIYRGDVRALDEVTLTVEAGEHCCLLGPNGAGKTTVIRLLQGALAPSAGTITILGAAASGRDLLAAKLQVGVVPQSPGLYPDLTVEEYLSFVASLYGRGQPGRTAEDYGLGEYLKRPCATLSGGYQRRLLVAAAVMTEPELLLFDEPTVGLDPLAASQTRSLLRAAMRNRTVLMSTHNLLEAEELCDTVIIMQRGSVLVHERIEDLRRQSAPRVCLRARQDSQCLGKSLDTLQLPWAERDGSVWLQLDKPQSQAPAVLRRLLSDGIDVYECRIVQPSLEDVFVDLVTQS